MRINEECFPIIKNNLDIKIIIMTKNLYLQIFISFIVFASAFTQNIKNRLREPIDRYRLVTRHNPSLKSVDAASPFTVGNGSFAFTADITGLQTFYDYYYENGTPIETLSDWCWHSFPNLNNYTLKDASKEYLYNGKKVLFPTEQQTPAGQWLRQNPHRMPLGKIGFELKKKDGSIVSIKEIGDISQTLDLWRGILTSNYSIEGQKVSVTTICHPLLDLIAVEVKSNLIQSKQIQIVIDFPYTYKMDLKNKPAYDWGNKDRHKTQILNRKSREIALKREVDTTQYFVFLKWEGAGSFHEIDDHKFVFVPSNKDTITRFTFGFDNSMIMRLPDYKKTKNASIIEWKKYWQSGGAIDFSGSEDLRANELERRIILSQYIMRAQCCGNFPPQESGLMHSSWYGKHHTEMIWWHTAHYALWGRTEFLEKNLEWYNTKLSNAKKIAAVRGIKGARWSKMVGVDGRESPGNNPFIIWNQPHPIYLSELIYRAKPNKETLCKWKNIVLGSAVCMASMVTWDSVRANYILGPPLWHAQETYDPLTTQNPTFELAYWRYGLELAQKWLERLDINRDKEWDNIIQKLAPLPTKDGLYVGIESLPTTFLAVENRQDHPSMLMAYGFLPGANVDTAIMRRTLHKVVVDWQWNEKIWGWDYPMIAMTATRLGEPELAVNILLKEALHNHYAINGNCAQTNDLPIYIPANGALLSAVAMMAAGWDSSTSEFPGFPKNGKWKIRFENLQKLP